MDSIGSAERRSPGANEAVGRHALSAPMRPASGARGWTCQVGGMSSHFTLPKLVASR